MEAINDLKAIKKCRVWGKDRMQALEMAIKALEVQTEVNIYDKEETFHNCTVQVLTNTVTGQTSVGWWKNNG